MGILLFACFTLLRSWRVIDPFIRWYDMEMGVFYSGLEIELS